jgi:protein O-mannosyl-transferase
MDDPTDLPTGLTAGTDRVRFTSIFDGDALFGVDVTLKSPHNGRGLMNYGLTQMSTGEIPRALDYFQRAAFYNPNYYILEVNLGVANGALHNDAEAERHFARALQLAPTEAIPHYYYAVWLRGKGRAGEAIQHLNVAITNNPSYLDASHLLMDITLRSRRRMSLKGRPAKLSRSSLRPRPRHRGLRGRAR